MKKKQSGIRTCMKYAVLIFVALIALFPIFWVISNSFKTLNGISQYPPQLFPDDSIAITQKLLAKETY